jgi:hypothetical protein
MPYRRLPNTDQSRIRAISTALDRYKSKIDEGEVITEKTFNNASTFFPTFENIHHEYLVSLENQKAASKKYYQQMHNARLYISHFIQVLNFGVIRKEIKRETKTLFDLEPDVFTVPDLSTESAIIKWGESIIKGERERINRGGSPIYNPAIAKVAVHYDIFKDTCVSQKIYQKSTNRYLDQITSLRDEADNLIIDIWNQVENFFKDYPELQRHELCQSWGVRYYLRKNEKE